MGQRRAIRQIARLLTACLVASIAPGTGVSAQDIAAEPIFVPPPPPGYFGVDLAVPGRRAGTIKAYFRRPPGLGPAPAVVGLHGCGGLFTDRGTMAARELEWAERFVAAGYGVLFADSFSARGYREICGLTGDQRPIRPVHRALDAEAALRWLSKQSFVDANRLALIGWSHGGSTVLHAVDKSVRAGAPPIRAAIAFYPGCSTFPERVGWAPRAPLTILIGSDDDWTPPAPCREIAGRPNVRLIEYPGAVHGFDAASSPRRTLTGVGISATGTGEVQIGTDPLARAAAFDEVGRVLATAFGRGSRD
ncbi:MAG: dienelactone hydrolase family protein [Hyphomicrobiaceae bacterium]|nr:dienelactone hydrolase family protein [Hyphomicrobiaceae bacterium]